MDRADFVLIRAEFVAKGDYESHDCHNENTITMYHSMSLVAYVKERACPIEHPNEPGKEIRQLDEFNVRGKTKTTEYRDIQKYQVDQA